MEWPGPLHKRDLTPSQWSQSVSSLFLSSISRAVSSPVCWRTSGGGREATGAAQGGKWAAYIASVLQSIPALITRAPAEHQAVFSAAQMKIYFKIYIFFPKRNTSCLQSFP